MLVLNKSLSEQLQKLSDKTPAPWILFIVCLLVGSLRAILEQFLQEHGTVMFSTALHYSVFYLLGFFLFALWWAPLLKKQQNQIFWLCTIGIIAGIFPPFIDSLLFGFHKVNYSYPFNFNPLFFTFGKQASTYGPFHLSLGEGISVWLVIVATTIITFILTKQWIRTALAAILSYLSLHAISYGSWNAIVTLRASVSQHLSHFNTDSIVIFIFCTVAITLFISSKKNLIKSTYKKSLHIIPFVLALLIGGKAVGNISIIHGIYAIILLLLGYLLFIHNNVWDHSEDQANNRFYHLSHQQADFAFILAIPLIFGAILLLPVPGILTLIYFLAWTVYHHPRSRLKRFFPIPYITEGLTGCVAILIGISCSAQNGQLHNIRSPLLILLAGFTFIGFALSSTIKDYKDIPGDQAAHIDTLYTIFISRQWTVPAITKLVLGFIILSHCTLLIIVGYFKAFTWSMIPIALIIILGFPLFLLKDSHHTRAVEACLIIDISVLCWLFYHMPTLFLV